MSGVGGVLIKSRIFSVETTVPSMFAWETNKQNKDAVTTKVAPILGPAYRISAYRPAFTHIDIGSNQSFARVCLFYCHVFCFIACSFIIFVCALEMSERSPTV